MLKQIQTIKSILKIGEINLKEGIKISLVSFFLSTIELFSIGFMALVVTKIFYNELNNVELSIFQLSMSVSSLTLIMLLFLSYFSKFFISYFLNKTIFKVTNEKQHNLRLKFFKLFSNLNFIKFQEKSSTTYIAILGNHIKTFGGALSLTFIFFGEIFMLLMILTLLLYVNFKITIILVATFLIFFFIYSKVKFLNPKQAGFENKEAYKGLYDFIINFFNSFKEIKIYNKYETINSNLRIYSDKVFTSDLKNNLISILPRLFLELIIVAFFSILLFSTIKYNLSIFNNLEYFSILFASVIRLMPFFIQVLRFQNTLRYSETFVDEINEYIIFLNNNQFKATNHAFSIDDDIKKITFRNINFSYDKKKILENCKLDLHINDFTLISGESGSGKSTLLNIICNFIKPSSSEILINDKLIDKSLTIENLFAYVPQDKFVFEGEIWKNISLEYEESNCNFEKIDEVLKLARLQIDKNYILFPNGQNLSGGQKQRLVIARALYFSKKFVIFDESTNELDDENEKKILQDIRKINNIGVLIVSHKNSIISLCDKKYKLIDKKLKLLE
ncbi:ATP-binding cassette domain-containing protein [Candidatus Pelagibacter bacterium nBUS_27]|uniref:ATP-binding cassette domain-containing protein n=1 Tax=Candidatus Pelagibacter bacterium nBUS_27 TaxID=3374188 RepID=UPI003EBB99C8